MIRKLSQFAGLALIFGSTGCCRMADRWCNNNHPPAVAATPYCVPPPVATCAPPPQACYPAPQPCYPAPPQGYQRPYGQ